MTRPLTPEQEKEHKTMEERLKEAAKFSDTLQAKMLAEAKRRPRANDDEGTQRRNIRLLSAEELAIRLQKQKTSIPAEQPSENIALPQQAEKMESSETRYTWSKQPNLSQFTKKKAIHAMIKQNPIYQNPVIKGIQGALGMVNADILKLMPFNR